MLASVLFNQIFKQAIETNFNFGFNSVEPYKLPKQMCLLTTWQDPAQSQVIDS